MSSGYSLLEAGAIFSFLPFFLPFSLSSPFLSEVGTPPILGKSSPQLGTRGGCLLPYSPSQDQNLKRFHPPTPELHRLPTCHCVSEQFHFVVISPLRMSEQLRFCVAVFVMGLMSYVSVYLSDRGCTASWPKHTFWSAKQLSIASPCQLILPQEWVGKRKQSCIF